MVTDSWRSSLDIHPYGLVAVINEAELMAVHCNNDGNG
jgi:hypothetical protein